MSPVYIAALRVAPAPDRRRVHIAVEITGSEEPPPYLELQILDPGSQVVGEMLIMGVVEATTEMTVHLRPPAPADETRLYTLRARLFFGRAEGDEETLADSQTTFAFAS